MKKVFTFLVPITIGILLMASVFLPQQAGAQSPEKMSYQAVIRDASDNLVTSTAVGMQISILQGSASGTAIYVETQTPTTNANGLVSIEIGTGNTSNDFSSIDWANGPYFIKTETDPAGGTSYTITGTSQLLSVPYALHSKTAETVTGGITETDPVYGTSAASGITGTDITNWNNKLDSETDPVFTTWDKTTGISITESQISDLDHFTISDETDPVFGASVASGITATDTTNWNNKLVDSYTETDPVFTAWDKTTGISITESQISDLEHFTTADETDPVFGASVASGITETDTTNWNNKQDQLTAGTGIIMVGNTISSSNDFYLGQDTLGGIVFYIYIGSDGNQHGLIVNPDESSAKWQSSSTTTDANRTWDGAYNMELMTESPAKTYCQGLSTGGFTDWYLPSIDELAILWHNRFHANNALNAGSYTLLSNYSNYWSSTEDQKTFSSSSSEWEYAFYFNFKEGNANSGTKTHSLRVRPIRAF